MDDELDKRTAIFAASHRGSDKADRLELGYLAEPDEHCWRIRREAPKFKVIVVHARAAFN